MDLRAEALDPAAMEALFDATPGLVFFIKDRSARYVRVNMLKNSDNDAVHLVEVRVYEAGK